MMEHQSHGEALFYHFRLEDQIPENHLLRLIDKHVSFDFWSDSGIRMWGLLCRTKKSMFARH